MLTRPSSQKIRPDHLDRLAVIYVRQSTLFQVRNNVGSTTRQYDLIKRAGELGWTPGSHHVVDQDQARSGTSIIGRDGFQWLVAEVGLGHVGAVLSLEVARLARSCSDWYRLLEICALADTLVIDEEGVYDPGAHNDRLLLGWKRQHVRGRTPLVASTSARRKADESGARPVALSLAHWSGLRSRG